MKTRVIQLNSVPHWCSTFAQQFRLSPLGGSTDLFLCSSHSLNHWKETIVTADIVSTNILPHRVPFGFGSLFLKFGKFSAVMDGDQQLPDQQTNKAQEQNGASHRQEHHQDVRALRTLWESRETSRQRETVMSYTMLVKHWVTLMKLASDAPSHNDSVHRWQRSGFGGAVVGWLLMYSKSKNKPQNNHHRIHSVPHLPSSTCRLT